MEPQAIDQFVGEKRTVKTREHSWSVNSFRGTAFKSSLPAFYQLFFGKGFPCSFSALITSLIQKRAKSILKSCSSGVIQEDRRMNPIGKEADGPTPQTEMDALLLGRTNVSNLSF